MKFWLVKTIVWVFLPLWCGGLPSEWNWISAKFAGCRQLWYYDFKFKNKKSAIGANKLDSSMKIISEKAGLHENWWKSFWFLLMQTDHNLCLNLCFDQSLAFEIQGTNVESSPKWYKRPKFLDSYSDKKALQSAFSIWFMLMWVSKNSCFK